MLLALNAEMLLTREELREVLMKNLPKRQNSSAIVNMLIECAADHTFDLKDKGPIRLSDEAARRLGWDFS